MKIIKVVKADSSYASPYPYEVTVDGRFIGYYPNEAIAIRVQETLDELFSEAYDDGYADGHDGRIEYWAG
jgi:hypothetical protein